MAYFKFKRGSRLPLLLVASIISIVALLVGLGLAFNPVREVMGVGCMGGQVAYHAHASLKLVVDGSSIRIPDRIGIHSNCMFWLHTHSDDGVIHIEPPTGQVLTLGQFFAVWGKPLSNRQIGDYLIGEGRILRITVNGQLYQGDPAAIKLGDGVEIVIEITKP